MTTPILKIRPPGIDPSASTGDYPKATVEFMTGTWHVTHSSLPMWKDNRNVTISYKPLDSIVNGAAQLDDIVQYQPINSDKVKTILGVDTYNATAFSGWDWRGKGWLKMITSHWEMIGHGELEGGVQWAVTYFAKTMFTRAGIDVYTKSKGGLPAEVIKALKNTLLVMDEPLKSLAAELFEVNRD